ncbi:uncharacterized protein mrvi1 isoform X2 [Anguilla anguilla]|uniref:uncharacterized protein mrvi1 isoform X2 n=1 Tax=Anguilla anguilla TaxID=7936 RepID=UPI0015AB3580|nr:uncharacterized protein mrvi1 isoform X2 [Anguilla anguilla]
MAESSMNGEQSCHVEQSDPEACRAQAAESPPSETGAHHSDRKGQRVPSLSKSSTAVLSSEAGLSCPEPGQLLENHDRDQPDTCERENGFEEDAHSANGFSEGHLLDIMFEACDTMGKGEVLASRVMQYLQDMTAQTPDQGKLTALYNMLDPNQQDRAVTREAFHSTMRVWIAQCCQTRSEQMDHSLSVQEDYYSTQESHLTTAPINGIFSTLETETDAETEAQAGTEALTEVEFPECGDGCYCEWKDLLGTVAELRHTHRQLSEQNANLLRSVAQSEDTNLQLTLEIAELKAKLGSAQRAAVRARSLLEELDEARRALKESQEKWAQAQARVCTLTKENENSKAHIKLIEDANEKLSQERTCAEGRVGKLMRMNAEIREELDETLVLLAEKDNSISKKTTFINELKISHMDNLRIIEGMQLELMRLQENSQQELLSLLWTGLTGVQLAVRVPSQDITLPPLKTHLCSLKSRRCRRERIWRGRTVRSAESYLRTSRKRTFSRFYTRSSPWSLSHSSTDSTARRMPMWAVLFMYLRKPSSSPSNSRQAPSNSLQMCMERDLALQTTLREEVEGRLEEALRQAQEAKKMATVNWWRALKMEEGRTKAQKEASQANYACDETEEKLRQAGATIQELQDQVRHLQAALRTALQQCVNSGEQRDAAVSTEPVEEAGGCLAAGLAWGRDLEAEKAMDAWRRVEATASQVAKAADLLHLSKGRLHQARKRVEAATERVEQALGRAADAEAQLNELKAKISKKLEPTDPSQSTDLGTEGTVSSHSSTERPTSPTALESVSQSSQAPPSHPPNIPSGEIICLTTGRGDSCVEDDSTSGTSCLTDTPTQAQVLSGSSESQPNSTDNDSTGPHVLAPARTQTALLETWAQDTTNPAPGKQHLETRPASDQKNAPESHTPEHTTGNLTGPRSEVPACNDSCQSEPVDDGRSQAVLTENPTAAVVLTAEEDPIEQCATLRERDLLTQAGIPTRSPAPFIATQAKSVFRRPPTMPTLPEEEEDSPEDLDSANSSPITQCTPVGNTAVTMAFPAPSIVFPRQDDFGNQDPRPLEQARPHSPRPRLSRNTSSGGPITTVDSTGHVIDLVKDQLPDLKLTAEDKQKNLELLEEAKRVSDRFLSRRGRRSTSSLSESPTGGLSPNPTPLSSPTPSRSSSLTVPPQTTGLSPISTPHPSPVPSRSNSLTVPPQSAPEELGANYISPPAIQVCLSGQLEDNSPQDQESLRKLAECKPNEKRKVSSGTLSPRRVVPAAAREDTGKPQEKGKWGLEAREEEEGPGRGTQRRTPDDEAPATGVAKPVPRPASQQAPCTAEIRTIGAFPPLMRAVSWDTVGSFPPRNGAQGAPPNSEEALSFFDKSSESLFKSSGYKDFPVQPVKMQKLAKMREVSPDEHKLIRNQSIVGSKLPDLSETSEQERGPSPCPPLAAPTEEEAKEKSDVMPNISDIMLRKLKLHRAVPGSSPPLTEKEIENAFVQLSLAFRNDNYTLETRMRQAERERNLTEENTEKELEEFKGFLKGSASLWQTSDQRDSFQRLLETVAVLHRLATRLSSRAEMVGAVRQEKRMNKATEVMMQYVENLKRTYEKDHAELMEFKKLANQNSNRCYGGSMDTGDDGVPRTSRSMSVTLGKALPRRRVSVAVVPKFNLLNIPGQSPPSASGPLLPVLCEASSAKGSTSIEPAQQPLAENGKSAADQEGETSTPAKPPCGPAEISSEVKAKIEEDAYNKGYQEGLKKSKELQELKEAEEKMEESQEEPGEKEEKEERERNEAKEKTHNSKYEKLLDVFERLCPKLLRRHRLLWIAMTLFAVTFFLVSVFTYFGDRGSALGDVSTGKAMGPAKKKFFGWNVRLQPKNPTPE